MKIKAILAVGKNGEIGQDGDLPWGRGQKADLANFKKVTGKHAVVMGRNTFQSLPKKFRPLPNRFNIVLSRDADYMNSINGYDTDHVICTSSLESAIKVAKGRREKELWIIGGSYLYHQALEYVDEVHVTVIHEDFKDADTYAKHLVEPEGLTKVSSDTHLADDNNTYPYSFMVYKKITSIMYPLHKILLDKNQSLSHVFLNSDSRVIKKIADEKNALPKEEQMKYEVEIELKIAGHHVDPMKFYDLIYNQYSERVKEHATKLVKEQTSDMFSEISDKLREYEEITNDWAGSINWEVDNPFNKDQ